MALIANVNQIKVDPYEIRVYIVYVCGNRATLIQLDNPIGSSESRISNCVHQMSVFAGHERNAEFAGSTQLNKITANKYQLDSGATEWCPNTRNE